MATVLWTGASLDVAQVDTLTPAGPIPGDEFKVTIGVKTVSVVAGAAPTVADICDDLGAALAASTIPEFTEVTWTEDDAAITATATTPGVPFTASVSVTKAQAAVPVQAAASATSGGSLVDTTTYYW